MAGGRMKSVTDDDGWVECALDEGRLVCPNCAHPLRRWGWARARTVRTIDGTERVRPRRARCAGCGRTHVLLPDWLLLRRADSVEVIGAALVAHARRLGYRRIARAIGRPPTTVRDWLRRWRDRARAVAALLGGSAGSPTAAVCAVYAAGDAVGVRRAWCHAARCTDGRVLSNTNPPHPALSGRSGSRSSERRTEA
jgi:predicted Fe-S protein YdhL (DUF1289 family)